MGEREPAPNETGKITLVVNERLKRRFKARAAELGIPAAKFFETIVESYMDEGHVAAEKSRGYTADHQ